jgi:aspartyl-tRNA(Asn)/glutamyl-tRNA(Gln) amidotransferase subunit B
MNLEPVIGLEIHVHLNTQSKMFCGCKNVSEAEEANRFVCPICMGFPGQLPVLNGKAVEWAIKVGLALNCKIASHTTFSRKSYFYPDLPKGYQISQYDEPICYEGKVKVFVSNEEKEIGITRAHMEEDAAKNIHDGGTLVDYTRSGTPLVEIVTEPDIKTPQEAKIFLEDLQRTIRYIGVSNADMENGDLRVDANISMREIGGKLNPKTECKNLNSFKAVERALTYEIARQTELWQQGNPPTKQSTRGWNDATQETVEQRVKEDEADYRYFPEPDIPPLKIDEELIQRMREALPELPHEKEARFISQFQLPDEQVRIMVEDRMLASYTENVFSEILAWNEQRSDVEKRDSVRLYKLAANYLLGDFRNILAEEKTDFSHTKISPENFAELIVMLHRAEVNRNAMPEVFRIMQKTGGDPSNIVADKGLGQVSDDDQLRRIVQDMLNANPAEVDKARAGKVQVVQFLMGKVMAETKGRANPQKVQEMIRVELGLTIND